RTSSRSRPRRSSRSRRGCARSIASSARARDTSTAASAVPAAGRPCTSAHASARVAARRSLRRPAHDHVRMTGPRACPRCGATSHAGQEYCLDCGLALRPERRRRWTGIGDRTVLALVLLVLGAFGALAAVAVGRTGGTATVAATRVRRVAAPVPAPSLPVIQTTTVAAVPPTLPTTTQPRSALTAGTLAGGY